MQEVSPVFKAVSAAIWASKRSSHARATAAQSALVGVRDDGRRSKASRISAKDNPTA